MDKNNIPTHYIPTGSVLKGRYRIDGYLGEGGFGITYKGTNTVLDLPVAIKEYFPGGYANRYAPSGLKVTLTDQRKGLTFNQWKDKFLAEARTLAKFSKDPGIVSVYDYFEENDTAYIVMEYLEGITLKEYVSTRGVFSPDDLCGKMLPLLDSLRDVHEENLIHRDISPDNIMLLKDGTFKLFDFGAAREFDSDGERSMSIILRPGYAPEEQYRSHGKQGPFTDVYAICGVMYFCLTGLTPEESTERVYQDELKPLSEFDGIPEHIASAVMKGLAIRSSDRFQTISELISALGGKEITPETNIPREHERPAEDHSSGTVMLERSAGATTTGDRTEFI
ncbi:MAG: serine/threonine protein kinase, partial [Ruminiclostridium sp.]|nr:serine/threonine protein kinase [Ruminiclostridium sp.]